MIGKKTLNPTELTATSDQLFFLKRFFYIYIPIKKNVTPHCGPTLPQKIMHDLNKLESTEPDDASTELRT